jgi:hypothetical protein
VLVIVYDIGFSRFKAAIILAHRARDEEIKNSELFVKICEQVFLRIGKQQVFNFQVTHENRKTTE